MSWVFLSLEPQARAPCSWDVCPCLAWFMLSYTPETCWRGVASSNPKPRMPVGLVAIPGPLTVEGLA